VHYRTDPVVIDLVPPGPSLVNGINVTKGCRGNNIGGSGGKRKKKKKKEENPTI